MSTRIVSATLAAALSDAGESAVAAAPAVSVTRPVREIPAACWIVGRFSRLESRHRSRWPPHRGFRRVLPSPLVDDAAIRLVCRLAIIGSL